MNTEEETKYVMGVCVKETNQENGPGHVSSFVQKVKNGSSQISHTSFFPGPMGSIINGLTLGSIPVQGRLASDHKDDLEQAEHVLAAQISKNQYKQVRKAQKEFCDDVQTGRRSYSVFSNSNPLAACAAWLAENFHAAHRIATEHEHHLPEDMCGIHVYNDQCHSKVKPIQVDNCASSVAHMLNKADFKFKNPKIPTFFVPELEKHGFKKVEKEEFMKEFQTEYKI